MIYTKKGFSFTKNLIIPNLDKTKILFGFQVSIGINADEPSYFYQTANWIGIGFGFNIKEVNRIPFYLHKRWNIKQYHD